MRIFHSKHQNLILQCYPPGKGADKKPNSSELSYLLYYASTRRVKLEKVVTFLKEKTENDVSHGRHGNLQVTLAILSALIEKCSDNLNVFASFITSMLQSVLSTKDLILCKSVVKTYTVLCDKLDEGLFTGDKEFVNSFSTLSEAIINLSTYNSEEKKPNQLEWKMIALLAIKHISHCLGYNAKISTKFIGLSIPILIKTVQNTNTQRNLLTRLRSNINIETDDRRLSRVISSKAGLSSKQIEEDFDNDALTTTDINEESFNSLKALFNTTLTNQIQAVTKSVVQFNYDSKVDLKWGSTFLEMCTTWIPVQLRFVALATLLSRLDLFAKDSNPKTPNYSIQYHYASNILGLVSSDVNMIGLSVSDIIRQVLSLQSNLILHQSTYIDSEQVKKLSFIYSNCVCHLSSHIYYADQIPDSIQEILLEVKSALEYSYTDDETQTHPDTVDAEKIHSFIITLLDNISTVFSILIKKSSSISRNRVNLEHWNISLPILAPETEIEPDRKTILSASQMFDIQSKYLKVFSDFLNNELSNDNLQDDDDDETNNIETNKVESSPRNFTSPSGSINENFSDVSKDFTQPDVNQYITHPDNFISHFLLYIDKFFERYQSPNTEIVLLLIKTLKEMIRALGINFVSNYIPFLYHWSLKFKDSNEPSQIEKYKDTFAHIILYYSLKDLDEIYPQELESYASNSKYYIKLLSNIRYRKVKKYWIEGLDSEPSDNEIAKQFPQGDLTSSSSSMSSNDIIIIQDSIKYAFTKDDLEEFACGNNFTIIWIDHKRPITIDFVSDPHIADRNTNAIINGLTTNLLASIGSSGGGSIIESEVVSLESSIHPGVTGKGLGTAGDISSIYSDLSKYLQKNNQYHPTPLNPNGTFNSYGTNGTFNGTFNGTIDGTIGGTINSGSISGGDFTNDSVHTGDSKNYNTPRISELKDLMSQHRKGTRKPSLFIDNGSTSTNGATSNSVLSKSIATTDVNTIIDGLMDDDDSAIVV
ncbi:uncharacterized protein RJT21DRAFT_118037 [Scheffersomyces amazonensis]|uniref:uncharacterized protein n=1 Tax=Scheffersomyces amazonensis TaxID=1078765 RepID=UPI00315D9B4F